MININNTKYYKTSEAAIKLGLHHKTLLRFASQGKICFYRPSPKKIFFSEEDIEKYIKGHHL